MIVYDASYYPDVPTPTNSLIGIGGESLWQNPHAEDFTTWILNLDFVTKHLEKADAENKPALFNFAEHTWNTDPTIGSGVQLITKAQFKERLEWWTRTWATIRAINPSQKLGVYAEFPVRNLDDPIVEYSFKYEPSQDNTNQWRLHKPLMKAWKLLNNRLSVLAECVDIVCPSLYLHYPKYKNEYWAAYAKANIEEAKQYGKEVYPYVWPRYHSAPYGYPPPTDDISLPFVIDLARWKQYLVDVVKCKPDGLIIWDYYGYGPWSQVAEHFSAASALNEVSA